ncbi:MAG TPA: 3-phosphoserine/phosphohydroxythreonine transaminase [Gammaproteobacteria bacterium]
MDRVFNFSPGPAALPREVMQQAQAEFLDWQGTGMSVMEVSHRSPEFVELAAESESDLRELMAIPDIYKVLFLQGGATLQFCAVPMNLAAPDRVADYVITGSWGRKSKSEAERFVHVNVAADAVDSNYTTVPDPATWQLTENAAYLHLTPNETIGGVEIPEIPNVSTAPIVADMSSTLLSRPVDVGRFGLIYAGAQKNVGQAGLTLVIVREDLIGHATRQTPGVTDYKVMAETDSMWNTPPTFAWYMASLVFKWLKKQGGLGAISARNDAKAAKLYAAIDASQFYSNPVDTRYRSRMNIPFTLPDAELDPVFLAESREAGLLNLKGHRSVGGMRASIYNAIPEEGVDALIAFMADFEARHG